MVQVIKKYETILILLFLASIFTQLFFKLGTELLLIAVIIYGLLIVQYIHEAKNLLVSIALALSASPIIFVYLSSVGSDYAIDFKLFGTLNYLYIAVVLVVLARKDKLDIAKSTYWLIVFLVFCILMIYISPIFNIWIAEFSILNYPVLVMSIYILVATKDTEFYGLRNLVKVIMMHATVLVTLDFKELLVL